jgi:toxin ParE1/3/4
LAKKIIEVLWTEPARNDLQNIYLFLSEVSEVIAFGIITKILDRTEILKSGFTKTGQVEPLLKNRKYKYRYLVEGNYKIIYFQKDNTVVISAVFDSRQNPEKLKRITD